MSGKDKAVLLKIIAHAQEAIEYTHNMNFNEFSNDRKTVIATAFLLSQIGELSKLISDELQNATPNISWQGMRGLRNRIVHDYDNINMTMFWEVLSEDLASLLQELKKLVDG
jgi:uncharacterized protein with HEPN domain